MRMEKSKIEWTKKQEETIEKMIEESEAIGYVNGYDDAIKEVIRELKIKFINKIEK